MDRGFVMLPAQKQPQGWRTCPLKILYSPKTSPMHLSPVSPVGHCGAGSHPAHRGVLILLSSMGTHPPHPSSG